MLSFLRRTQWLVFDCVRGEVTPIEKLPFHIGSGEGADLRLEGPGVAGAHCVITKAKGIGRCISRLDAEAVLVVNGVATDSTALLPGEDYSLKIGPHFLALRGGEDLGGWAGRLNPLEWSLFDSATEPLLGPMPPSELCRVAIERRRPMQDVVLPGGLSMGFYLGQLIEVFGPGTGIGPADAELWAGSEPERAPGYTEFLFRAGAQGALTCPVCWLRFDAGDILHVAVHEALRGDPELGEDAPQRFRATRFNDRGQALDPMGLPCTDLACPHCRRVLPPDFTEVPHHILSIVGDQSAGKSYYLSVLIKLLPASLYQQFGVVLQDADAAGNALLNDMKKTLFSAQSPEQARLIKTQLEGIMYERLPRYGRWVALPRPFVFSLASLRDPACRHSIILYDNAGEHFQPGRDSVDSPGAQHVASSSGLFFLFDPFNSPEFRRWLGDWPDPQTEKPIMDQQDVILSELKVRIKKLLKLPAGSKVATPLAMLVGKCDAWMHRLGPAPFRSPVVSGRLELEAIEHNSRLVRALLLELCPMVVANAEQLSETICYFPVSSFGHPPVKIGQGDYVPDPRRLQPVLVEVPPLWVLSRIAPDLVPAG